MNKIYKTKIMQIEKFMQSNMSKERLQHSYNVANYAKKLAKVYGKRKKMVKLAYLAGLAHDITKEFSDSKHLEILKKTGEQLTKVEKQKINLLHGLTGAYVLEKQFGIKLKDVLDAVKYHTFGSKKLKTLGKLVYIADKIEPDRCHNDAKEARAKVGKLSLNELTLFVLNFNIEHIEEKGGIISPHSLKMKKMLERKISKK
ncbi:MAG: bis(5'-nucleosyl)-tetraphosphatase (symmetrical) YqeK [Treponemataceae bacterium]